MNSAAGSSRLPFLAANGAIVVLGLLCGCHRRPAVPPEPATVVAEAAHADAARQSETIRYPVEVAPRYSTVMSFRVTGKLVDRTVRLGDNVRKGQVLARLDAVDARKQAVSAAAGFAAAEHRLTFARQQLERDNAQAALNLIAANQLEQTQDGYAAALAARDQLAAQLAVARNTVRYNSLVADHDGVVTSENADTGQVVAAGEAIYGIAWSGDVDVNLDAAAADLGRLQVDQPARVELAALPGQIFDARVREVAPRADAQSRTYRVKLTLQQPNPAVRLGMTGDASFVGTSSTQPSPAPAFYVPATALFHRGKDPALWVIRPGDSTLELRPVTVRTFDERSVAISSGLKEGDAVVVAGVHTVYAGQHVKAVAPLFAADAGDAP